MKSITNMKIGRKLAVVIGGITLLLVGMSVLSLWGNATNAHLTLIMNQRLTKARLADRVDADTTGMALDLTKMIMAKKAAGDLMDDATERRKDRTESLDQFRTLADSPTSIKHGADMAELVQSVVAAFGNTSDEIAAGKLADALKSFKTYSSLNTELRAKAQEASKFQLDEAAAADKDAMSTSSTIWMALLAGSFLAIAGSIFGGILLTRSIAKPLARFVAHLEEIAKGDVSKDARPDFLLREDEIGTIARAEQKMIESLRSMIKEISGGVQVLSSASTELMSSSAQMTSGSRHASDKAHLVSAAAEEMSSNITSVAAGMEETTTNLATVASATEQMTSTIGEIAGNSEKARQITGEATRQAARITQQIHQLGEAAREIGKVTETITEISSQTNLLALNATIEAARAGSAGKGFAVVATEIKALAQQTAAATEDIKARIAGVQDATSGGITEIEKVSNVIREVSDIVASIAAAIEEQATATKDIARNVAEASAGVTDANTRVSQTSTVSREIAKDIVDVDHAAGDMASGSDHVRTSASELSVVAERLKETAGRFHV